MSGYVNHAWRHRPKAKGGTDPLVTGGDLNPYSPYTNLVLVPDGTDPTTNGTIWLSVATDLINPSLSGDRAIILGQTRLEIDTPGVTGTPGPQGVYNIPLVHQTSNFGFEGAVGAGYTSPGGVPYTVILVSSGSGFGYANMLVTNLTDPDETDYHNWARPDWPGTYAADDILFSGIWNIPVIVD